MDHSFQLPTRSGNSPMINYRKDAKKAVKFTFMVAGELGTGKSTFINCLLNRNIMPHAFQGSDPADTKTLSFTLAHAVSLPNTSITYRNKFNAACAGDEPGIALTETSVEILDEENARLQLNIIDTPGFGDNLNNDLCYVEIENYLKQQFDLVLAEETRIRRNPRFVDTRVHVLLYFITPTGHGLREMDIACMKRLAKYVNIIPVIGRADSFTEDELKHFKNQIKIDIERFNVPIFQFDNYMEEYDEDDDYELIEECKFLSRLQPFAIIASEQNFEIKDTTTGETKTIKARQYPWGLVDVNNPKYSDFPILKSVLLGSHLLDLKEITHDFLYETYRTERLSKVTGSSDDFDSESAVNAENGHSILATAPSLSNLAQLTEVNDSAIKLDLTKEDTNETTSIASNLSKKAKSMLLDGDELTSQHLRDNASFTSTKSTYSSTSKSNEKPESTSFKRMSIAPQRSQLRQISETVPYVIRHERILERQHKLEEMEMASAKELANRAALLEQKAAQLKAREKLLLEKLELYKKAEALKAAEKQTLEENSATENGSATHTANGQLHDDSTENYTTVPRDETLTDINSERGE